MNTTPRIGHVHLKVSRLEPAVDFYREVLGMELTTRYGNKAAFLSYGGYHHHLGLNVWDSENGPRPHRNTTGLYHFAILYPTRAALAVALQKVLKHGYPLDGASDHGVSQAVYLSDPDGNGIELYWDRPEAEWPRTESGEIAMYTERLDLDDLLAEAPRAPAG